jgi:hypothetical protein
VTDIVPTSNQLGGMEILPTRQARSVGRQLARMSASTDLRVRGIENESDIQASKVEAVGYVGKRAMFVVGSVTQAEQQLGQMFPMAVSRLQAIGDMVAYSATEIVADTQMRLRRS